jgi:hypothetical protein
LAASSSTFSILGGELSKVAALAIKAAAIWPFRRAKLQCKPGSGAGFGVGERQCAGQEVGKRSLLAGFGFEANKQGELGHIVILWVNGLGESTDEPAV